MKITTLATTIALSMPLAIGSVYAQTTQSAETGNNRSADGGAMTTNPTPNAPGKPGSPGSETGKPVSPGMESNAASTAPGTQAPGTTAPATNMSSDTTASTEAITGWSAKDDIIGKSVFNENDEKVGDINDVVISSDGQTLYLLVGAGGFLGMGQKDVAVPFERFQRNDDRVLLSGYTKEQLKALPEVRTAPR